MNRRLLLVSAFLPPVQGGVEFFVAWVSQLASERGWLVRTVGCRGQGDLMWPAPSWQPANVPLARPSPSAMRAVLQEIRAADCVLIQNFFYPLSNWAALATRRCHAPALTIVHGNELAPAGASGVVRVGSRLQAATLGRRQFRVAPPLAISESSRAFIGREFGLEAPVLPLPLPDLSWADTDGREAGDRPFRIVFSGRLVDLKDPHTALTAVREVAREFPVELHVLGDGPLRSTLERGAPEWVWFHGRVDRHEAIEVVRTADCFVATSVTDNAQTSLLEAMAMGVPSVSTAVGDAPVYLRGALSECLVPVRDHRAIAEAIRRIAGDPRCARDRARARATELRELHDGQRVADALENYIDAVCRRSWPPASA